MGIAFAVMDTPPQGKQLHYLSLSNYTYMLLMPPLPLLPHTTAHFEISRLVWCVRGPKDGNLPGVKVTLIWNGHYKAFHRLSLEGLKLHGQGPQWSGTRRRHAAAIYRHKVSRNTNSLFHFSEYYWVNFGFIYDLFHLLLLGDLSITLSRPILVLKLSNSPWVGLCLQCCHVKPNKFFRAI